MPGKIIVLTISFLVLFFSLSFNLVYAQSWQTMESVPEELSFPVVTELNGNIHVIGGGGPAGATDLHLRYTPSTDTWDTLPPVPYPAQQPGGATVDGKIFFCGGGYPNTGTRLDSHFYYHPDSNAWFPVANMPVETAIHEAVELDGKLYILSGQPNKTLCEYYSPVSNTWTALNPLPDMNFWYGAIVKANNTLYRFGGGGYTSPVTSAHKYNKTADTWSSIAPLPEARHGMAGAAINDTLIALIGGYLGGYRKNTVWIFNTNTETYAVADSLIEGRDYHGSVNAGGCVYSIGGDNPAGTNISTSNIKHCNLSSVVPSGISNQQNFTKPYRRISQSGSLEIVFSVSAEPSIIKVVDMCGRIVYTEMTSSSNPAFRLSNSTFSIGNYLVVISGREGTFVEKWINTGKN